jgi:hypothetical protein
MIRHRTDVSRPCIHTIIKDFRNRTGPTSITKNLFLPHLVSSQAISEVLIQGDQLNDRHSETHRVADQLVTGNWYVEEGEQRESNDTRVDNSSE